MTSKHAMYVGLDTHKKFTQGCILDNDGNTILEQKFKNDPHPVDMFMLHVKKNDSIIAIESSSCWQYLYDYLADAGYTVVLANQSRIRLISESRKKTDKHDAKILADLLRMNMLPESYAAPSHVRLERQITRHRLSLKNMQKQIKNKIHAILRRHGYQTELDDIFTKKGIQYIESLDVPMHDRYELDDYISILKDLTARITSADEHITTYVEKNPHAKLLRTHVGIDYYSALTITGEIGDIRRFDAGKKLVSFAGLNPSVSQSGERCYTGRIAKQGSKHLRRMLIQCANVAVRYDKPLRSYYLKKMRAKGHNKAIVAVARKMLINVYAMLSHNIPFHALRSNKAS